MLSKALLKETKEFAIITLACAVYSAAWTALVLPYGIVSGGIAGLSNLLFYAFGINVAASYAVVNAILFIAALKLLGVKFFAKSIYATIAMTVFLWIGQHFLTDPASGELVRVLENERFMAMLLGCATTGLCVAILLSCSGSSGGTDIIAAIANKYFDIPIPVTLVVIDLGIIGSGLFIPSLGTLLERVRFVAFAFSAMAVECMTINYVLNMRRRSVQFLIFTHKHEEISRAIAMTTGHTMTLLDASGWYTGKKMKVICILAWMNESAIIFSIVHSIDPAAFVSQSRVIGVYGEGFDNLKARNAQMDFQQKKGTP